MSSKVKQKCLLIDLDGTVFKHGMSLSDVNYGKPTPHATIQLRKWRHAGHIIIFTTGRTESERKYTEEQLAHWGIQYAQLVMDCGSGQRILINDSKPYEGWEGVETAVGITVERDKGLKEVDI